MSDGNNWTDEWLNAQQKFVESWSHLAKHKGDKQGSNSAELWADCFDLWRKQYAPPAGEADQVIDKCTSIGRGYFALAEQIGKQVSSGEKPHEVINQILEQLKTLLQQQADSWSPFQQAPEFMSHWAAPSTGWQKMAMAMMPMQFAEANPGIYGIGEDFDKLSQILSAPGIGLLREHQEKQQQGMKLALEYFQANHQFNLALLRTSIESLQLFQQKLAASSKDNADSPDSLRSLYDLWVDTSEARYADFAISSEYQSLYGDMVNRLMAAKKHYIDLADDYLQSLNLPTRRELDTLEQRVQQLRRDNHDLRRELKELRALISQPQPAKKRQARKK